VVVGKTTEVGGGGGLFLGGEVDFEDVLVGDLVVGFDFHAVFVDLVFIDFGEEVLLDEFVLLFLVVGLGFEVVVFLAGGATFILVVGVGMEYLVF
jgi:hypothetical protein